MLEENLKAIKGAKLDIELLRRKNELLCQENDTKIEGLQDIIQSTEAELEVELKQSGEKKLECKLGYCAYRVMPDKWEYDDQKILLWCKDFKMPYYYTKEIVRKLELKTDINLGKLKSKEVTGITVTPQDPKFGYKLKGGL